MSGKPSLYAYDENGTSDAEKDSEESLKEINESKEEIKKEFVEDKKIEQVIQSMTLKEKVGQMFIVEPKVFSDKSSVTEIDEINLEKVKKYDK